MFCDSDAIRTHDLLLRRQLLYPAELRNLYVFLSRDDKIRTCDLFVPNEARYQAALHPAENLENAKILIILISLTVVLKFSLHLQKEKQNKTSW